MSPWTVAHQTPLSMGFSRQEYWSGLPFPSPGDLPDPEIQLTSPALSGRFFTTEPPWKPITVILNILKRSYWKFKNELEKKCCNINPLFSASYFFWDFVLISSGAHILDYQELIIKNNYFRKLDLYWNSYFQKLVINNDLKNLSFFCKETVQRSF